MDNLLRGLVIFVGASISLIGLAFLVQPELMAEQFYITPIGSQGLATIRADLTAFFVVGGVFALWGARDRRADLLIVPIMLLGIALFGRFVSLVFDGVGPVAIPPMLAEVVMIVILVGASRTFSNGR